MHAGKIFSQNTNKHRYRHFAAACMITLILIVFYRDVVFNNQTFLMETPLPGTMPDGPFKYKGIEPGFVANDRGAIAWYKEPLDRFVSKSVKRGDLPLWNPYAGLAGTPLLADGQTAPLEPLQFLFFLIPDRYWTYAVDAQLLLRFFLAGFFGYLFACRLKIAFLGRVSTGILFMLSSYFVTFGNHPQIKTEILIPLVLYGYDRLADLEDRLGPWLCTLFVGWAILAGMPESTFFVLFLGTLWYFYKSIFIQKENHDILQKVRGISIRYVSSTVLGFLISAAYLLLFLENVSLSASTHAANNDVNWGGRVLPLWYSFSMILRVEHRYFLQFGVAALFVLIFSFFTFKKDSKFHRVTIFFSLYAAFLILSIFSFPLTGWIRELPVFDRIVIFKYAVPSITFCLAVLAGIFIDETHTRLSYKGIAIALFIIPLFSFVVPKLHDPKSFLLKLPDDQVIYAAVYFLGGIFLALFFVTFLIKTGRLNRQFLQILLLLLLLVEPFYWGAQMRRPNRYDPYFQNIPRFIHHLKNDNGIYRTFSMSGILYPNVSTAYEIFDIRWLSALMPRRAYDFTTNFITSEEPKIIRFTGTSYPISDQMFDLLNVKYILDTNTGICESDSPDSSSPRQPVFFGKGQALEVTQLFINNSARNVVLAHPLSNFEMVMNVPEQTSSLDFSIGLNPVVFQPDRGDGVDFAITALYDNTEFPLFTKYIDPKSEPCDRQWIDESISLTQWAGKEITLRFSTNGGPMKDTSWDWAYWGDIRLNSGNHLQSSGNVLQETDPISGYEIVHRDSNVEIFQNTDVYPRAFVVYDIINASSFNQVLDLLKNPDLDLRQTAIVENFPGDLSVAIQESEQKLLPGSATVKRITPDRAVVEVETNAPGLLVLSEQYYPGWRAYVDDSETPIYAVDGILRGVFISKGKHTILFKYQPFLFSLGLIISITSLLTVLIGLIYPYRQDPLRKD